jgi:hypothetical protein
MTGYPQITDFSVFSRFSGHKELKGIVIAI